eukprot:COSAG01_NODE_6996_length_3399_cov_2.423939_4_plen_65_part_01
MQSCYEYGCWRLLGPLLPLLDPADPKQQERKSPIQVQLYHLESPILDLQLYLFTLDIQKPVRQKC